MVSQETWIRRIKNDLHIFRCYCLNCVYANKKWVEMGMKSWWLRLQFTPMWTKFMEWRLDKQSKKFAKEIKRKNYKPREPWDNGIWK